LLLDINPLDKIVEVNQCPRVTNPILFDPGNMPTSDGLLSYEMFGPYGSRDRREIFGHIDLGKKFIHPVAFKAMVSMDRNFRKALEGTSRFKIVGGELVEDEAGETGIDFLTRNIRKLTFASTGSALRDERRALVNSLKDDEILVGKWLVIPPFFRDVNLSKAQKGQISVDELNTMYSRLLNLSLTIASPSGGFSFVGHATEAALQDQLLEIFEHLTQRLAKKNGIIQKGVLGKSIDYAVRAVISAPKINAERPEEMKVSFERTGVPLSHLCVEFFPFFVHGIQEFLQAEIGDVQFIEDEKGKRHTLKDPLSQFPLPKIKKMIQLYIKSEENRFDPIMIKTDDGKEYPLALYREDLLRDFTLIDLLYIVAKKVTADKHVYITRYPVEHHQNIHASKIHVLSTRKTKVQKLGNRMFEDYPEIFPDYPEEDNGFVDTLQMSNAYLAALNGDYDGDTVSVRGVFSQEANQEAEKNMRSTKNLLDSAGEPSRKLGNEAVLCLYMLTAD
jgi:DNA-directed RNA polymerase beta' subunit